jgi:hypothetical protein
VYYFFSFFSVGFPIWIFSRFRKEINFYILNQNLFRIEKISDFKKVQILKSWSDLKILDLGKMFKFKKFQILEEVKISNFEKCSDFRSVNVF